MNMNIDTVINNIRNLRPDDFTLTPWILDNVYNDFENGQVLGQGAMGMAMLLPDLGVVVKITQPCGSDRYTELNRLYCDDMYTDEQIIRIPHDNKVLMRISNYLCEGIIGGFLNRLRNYTYHFVDTYGIYFSKYNLESYHIMEPVSVDMYNMIETKADIYLMLFQIAHGLFAGQKMYRFTHYDLHSGNIGYVEPTDEYKYFQYHYSYGDEIYTVYVKDPKFLVKIVDFGTSRLEEDDIIINQKFDRLPIRSFGVFNPYYDFMAFVGSLIFFWDDPLSRKLFSIFSADEINGLVSAIFDEDIILEEAYRQYYHGWRPNIPDIRASGRNFANMSKILEFLTYNLILLGKIVDISPDDTNSVAFTERLPLYQYEDYPIRIGVENIARRMTIDEGMYKVTQMSGDFFDWRDFNFTGRNNRPSKQLVIHYTYINSKVVKKNGYSFSSLCCKMDPINFMENHYGVAINGGFFDIFETYKMLGPYRQYNKETGKYYETIIPINQIYDEYYGYVIVDGGIDIIKPGTANIVDAYQSRNVFLSGPVLVWEGKAQITEETINTVTNFQGNMVKIFQCQSPNNKSHGKVIGNTFNCDAIYPGELSHGGNPNPRTMLVIRDDPYDVVIVVVEGRNNRSDGADFLDLVEIAKNLGAYHAINLDGGMSSNMVWRTPEYPYVVQASNHLDSYPVGNIIAIYK